ncbi:MAG TPA: KTSC domain-containing protein [Leptolyngbyaceae cyanobacterium M65_K2018_010]|nr:KTSC domain-containing protein [Leptolyngbyaceae cyanobacterium M65_K2018_010]
MRVYQYFEVPRNVYEELMASDSKGSYMRKLLRI